MRIRGIEITSGQIAEHRQKMGNSVTASMTRNAPREAIEAEQIRAMEDDEELVEIEELDEEIEPQEDDIFIQPSGPLGSLLSVGTGHKHIGEFVEHAEAEAAIKAWMEKEKFWPSVWFVSDHGNISPYQMESSTVQATGEADQDYDHAPFDAICKALGQHGYKCKHKEFDKYQGIYLDVFKEGKKIDRFWVEEYLPEAGGGADLIVFKPESDSDASVGVVADPEGVGEDEILEFLTKQERLLHSQEKRQIKNDKLSERGREPVELKKKIKSDASKKVGEYEIVDHGLEHAQYFQGHGLMGTRWEDAQTGAGDSQKAALDEALEQLAQNGWELSPELEAEAQKADGSHVVGMDLFINGKVVGNAAQSVQVGADVELLDKESSDFQFEDGEDQFQFRSHCFNAVDACDEFIDLAKENGLDVSKIAEEVESECQRINDSNEHYYYVSVDVKAGGEDVEAGYDDQNVILDEKDFRIVEKPDSDVSMEDLKGDTFNREANPDIPEEQMAKEEQAFERQVEQSGVFGYELQWWNPQPGEGWEHIDSCYGFVGPYDENDADQKHYIVEELKARIPEERRQRERDLIRYRKDQKLARRGKEKTKAEAKYFDDENPIMLLAISDSAIHRAEQKGNKSLRHLRSEFAKFFEAHAEKLVKRGKWKKLAKEESATELRDALHEEADKVLEGWLKKHEDKKAEASVVDQVLSWGDEDDDEVPEPKTKEEIMERLEELFEEEHGGCDDMTCDMSSAWDHGYTQWALYLFDSCGAASDEFVKLYKKIDKPAFKNAAEKERKMFVEEVPHAQCPHCNAVTWDDQMDEKVHCGSCGKEFDTRREKIEMRRQEKRALKDTKKKKKSRSEVEASEVITASHVTLYANPYDIEAEGFYFKDMAEYDEKYKANKNSSGGPVEEYEIDFIDGDTDDAKLFGALKINQATLEKYFDDILPMNEEEKAALYHSMNVIGMDLEDAIDDAKDNKYNVRQGTIKEYAEEFVDDVYGKPKTDLEEFLYRYYDPESFARDLELGGDMHEFEFGGETWIAENH